MINRAKSAAFTAILFTAAVPIAALAGGVMAGMVALDAINRVRDMVTR